MHPRRRPAWRCCCPPPCSPNYSTSLNPLPLRSPPLPPSSQPMPHKMPSMEALLSAPTRDDVSRLRLSRVLIALASTTAALSPLTAAAAVHELGAGRLARMLARDRETGRLVLPVVRARVRACEGEEYFHMNDRVCSHTRWAHYSDWAQKVEHVRTWLPHPAGVHGRQARGRLAPRGLHGCRAAHQPPRQPARQAGAAGAAPARWGLRAWLQGCMECPTLRPCGHSPMLPAHPTPAAPLPPQAAATTAASSPP